jgi:transcriptional regulator with XRE-family HTH domain
MVYFKTNLKRLRMNRGLNQTELAAELGLRPNTISNYEHGVSSPDYETLQLFVKFFEISVDDILYKDLTKEPKFNSLYTPPRTEMNYPVDEGEITGVQDPQAPYGLKKNDGTAFWIIMEHIMAIRKDLEEVKTLLNEE